MQVKNDLGIDWIIAAWLSSNTYTGSNNQTSISASNFCRSVRQNVLSRVMQYNGEEEPTDISTMLSSSIGTALHRDIQAVWENDEIITNALKNLGYSDERIRRIHVNPEYPIEGDTNLWFEKRVEKEINGWKITGQFDLVVNDTIHDFKSTKTYITRNKTKEGDYKIQLSIYRWLNQEIITNDIGVIHYINTDYNQNYVHSYNDYPLHPFTSINVPLMSIQETEEFICKRIRDIEYYTENLTELPRCNDHTLMIDKPIWQYFASSTSTKASKNFDTKLEALQYMSNKGNKGMVKAKEQEPIGCKYCNCKKACTQYKDFVIRGIIK